MTVKAVIFDMDGTLIEAKDWHFNALNEALEIFGVTITRFEHETTFDGLPTKVKLAMLNEQGRIPAHLNSMISAVKQERTIREIARQCYPRVEHLLMMAWLKERGFKIAVATNSIRSTAEVMLKSSGLYPFLDELVTNEDVKASKPDPEIFRLTSKKLGLEPSECLVIEDHDYGLKAAQLAGCEFVRVESVETLTTQFIELSLQGLMP
jgi:HAD superfamily hydrolase (TIGR01509 family)